MNKGIKAFITYAHSDSRQKDELQKRLAVMKQNGEIAAWDDNQILAGDEWEKEIATYLAGSDILLYLVSANSLASKNCNEELIEALKTTNTTTIPIILEPCDWKAHEIGKLEVLPDKGKAINRWKPQSVAWQNVVEGIRKSVNKIERSKMESPTNEQEKREIAMLALFQQANFLQILGEFDQAIQLYSEVIKLDHDLPATYYNRGNAYYRKGDHDKAIADYDKAIELDTDYADAYNSRGAAYYKRNGKGDDDRAITDYDEAIKLDTDYPLAYNNRGVARWNKGEYDKAIADLDKAMELDRDYAEAYNNRSLVHQARGDYDLAIADHDKAIALDSNLAEAHNNRGNTYKNKGDYDLAIADYDKAIELEPDYAEAYNNRGTAYSDKGEYDRAIADFDKAIALKPDLAIAYNNRGLAYHGKGDYERAISDYSKAIALKPDYAEAYCNRGEARLHLKLWEEAKRDLKTARDKGIDIIDSFNNDYESVADFESKTGIKLPADIAEMLTRKPKKGKS